MELNEMKATWPFIILNEITIFPDRNIGEMYGPVDVSGSWVVLVSYERFSNLKGKYTFYDPDHEYQRHGNGD